MKFRLTTGEHGTKWGKQWVYTEGEAENAIEFLRNFRKSAYTMNKKENVDSFLNNCCWIDAGENTIPIDVANLIF